MLLESSGVVLLLASCIRVFCEWSWGFPGDPVVKNRPAVQELGVRFLGREDPLEEGMAAHSHILAWEIPWSEEPCGLQFMGSKRVRHNLVTERTHMATVSEDSASKTWL